MRRAKYVDDVCAARPFGFRATAVLRFGCFAINLAVGPATLQPSLLTERAWSARYLKAASSFRVGGLWRSPSRASRLRGGGQGDREDERGQDASGVA